MLTDGVEKPMVFRQEPEKAPSFGRNTVVGLLVAGMNVKVGTSCLLLFEYGVDQEIISRKVGTSSAGGGKC